MYNYVWSDILDFLCKFDFVKIFFYHIIFFNNLKCRLLKALKTNYLSYVKITTIKIKLIISLLKYYLAVFKKLVWNNSD